MNAFVKKVILAYRIFLKNAKVLQFFNLPLMGLNYECFCEKSHFSVSPFLKNPKVLQIFNLSCITLTTHPAWCFIRKSVSVFRNIISS